MAEEPADEQVVTLSYARTQLHALIREVEAGRHVRIRGRDGRSAALVPYQPDPESTKP